MKTSPRVRALLQAARVERPPEGNEARLLAAVGLSAMAPGGAAATAAGMGARGWSRGLGLGAGVGMLVVVAALAGRWELGVHGASPGEPVEPFRGGIEREEPRVAVAAWPATRPAQVSADPATAAPPTLSTAPTSSTAGARPPLGDELTLLGHAKLALARGDATTALAVLADHDRAFPRGALGEEAAALRIEALVAAGRIDQARRAADAFDASHPRSPYAPRLHTLLQAPPPR